MGLFSPKKNATELLNKQLQDIFDASLFVTIIATDTEGTITFFNKGAEKILGYSSEEVIGKLTPEIIHDNEEVAKRAIELTEELHYPVKGFETFVAYAKQGKYEEREWTYICKDKRRITVQLSITPIYNDHNEIKGFLGTGVDITQRKEAEEKLRRSEERFRRLFEENGDALLLIEDGIFIDCNEVTVNMLHAKTKEEVLNTHPSDLSPEIQPDGLRSDIKAGEMMRLAFEKGHHRFEWMHQRVDGELFPVEVLLTPVNINNKQMLHTCWRDITDRKKAEEQLRHSQKMEVVGQLAGGVAHDFNNMLSSIMGAGDILKQELPKDTLLLNLADVIVKSAQRAGELTKKLLTFSRKGSQHIEEIHMHELLQNVKNLLEHTIDKNITLTLDLSATEDSISGDQSQLENALMNLGVNARDAMTEGGTLTFRTTNITLTSPKTFSSDFTLAPGDFLHISVEDTGKGIPHDLLVKVFEPFFTTKEQGKGTGLGLASVYGTMQTHQGAITIESTIKRGSTFHLYFPLSHSSNIDSANAAPHDRVSGGNETILIVDDEQMVRLMLQMWLERIGYSILTAENGKEGYEQYKAHQDKIQLVILDMIMPEMKGSECFHLLKEINPDVKVIITSGFTQEENVMALLDEGLAGFIEKPYPMEKLGELISSILHPKN